MIYFASDFHLGTPNHSTSLLREKNVVRWLHSIAPTAQEIYLMGDVFDFWFEYDKVIPKYFVRLMGTIAQLTDNGTPIHFFTGNHDMWTFGYLEQELGVTLHRQPVVTTLQNHRFYLAHGDGLGPGDGKYKFLKKFFTNSTLQWLTARIHPNLLLYLAHSWSQHSRLHSTDSPVFLNDNEWLYQHCIDTLKTQPDIDFFIFGHRHLPINVPIADTHSQYLNTGDWLHHNTFVKYDGSNAILERYQNTF